MGVHGKGTRSTAVGHVVSQEKRVLRSEMPNKLVLLFFFSSQSPFFLNDSVICIILKNIVVFV